MFGTKEDEGRGEGEGGWNIVNILLSLHHPHPSIESNIWVNYLITPPPSGLLK